MLHKNAKTTWFRTIALITALLMPVGELSAYAQIDVPYLVSTLSFKSEFLRPDKITVPEDLGSIQEVFKGKGKNLIVHIQDVHGNLQAQENLSKLVKYLHESYDIDLVAVEGAAGELPMTQVRRFPDAEIRAEVSKRYLESFDITGDEYYVISEDPELMMYGAERMLRYYINRDLFFQARGRSERLKPLLKRWRVAVRNLENTVYNKALREFTRTKRRYDKHTGFFIDYARYLWKEYPEVLGRGYPDVSFPILKGLLEETLEEAGPSTIRLALEELEVLEEALLAELIKNEREEKLFDLAERSDLLEKLINLELTPADYEAISNLASTFTVDYFRNTFTEVGGGARKEYIAAISEILKSFKLFFIFYKGAKARDEELARNTQRVMIERRKRSALAITGGFHTPGLTERWRRDGVSYVVIQPHMDKPKPGELNAYQAHAAQVALAMTETQKIPLIPRGGLDPYGAPHPEKREVMFAMMNDFEAAWKRKNTDASLRAAVGGEAISGFSASEDGAAQPPTGFGARGGAIAPISLSSSAFHTHTFGPLGGARREADDLLPSPTAQIPPELLKAAKERLKDAYPELFKLYKKHVNDRDYFIEPQEGQGLEGLLSTTDGDLLFILDERFNEEHKEAFKLSGEARDLLLYLYLIDITIQLALKEDSLTTDLNQQIISFLYQAEAYLSLEGPQQDLLKQAASIIDTQTGETFLEASFKEMDGFDTDKLFTNKAYDVVSAFFTSRFAHLNKGQYETEKVTGYFETVAQLGVSKDAQKVEVTTTERETKTDRITGDPDIGKASFMREHTAAFARTRMGETASGIIRVVPRNFDQLFDFLEAHMHGAKVSREKRGTELETIEVRFMTRRGASFTSPYQMRAHRVQIHSKDSGQSVDRAEIQVGKGPGVNPSGWISLTPYLGIDSYQVREVVVTKGAKKLVLILSDWSMQNFKKLYRRKITGGKGHYGMEWEVISESEAVARHEEFEQLQFNSIEQDVVQRLSELWANVLRWIMHGELEAHFGAVQEFMDDTGLSLVELGRLTGGQILDVSELASDDVILGKMEGRNPSVSGGLVTSVDPSIDPEHGRVGTSMGIDASGSSFYYGPGNIIRLASAKEFNQLRRQIDTGWAQVQNDPIAKTIITSELGKQRKEISRELRQILPRILLANPQIGGLKSQFPQSYKYMNQIEATSLLAVPEDSDRVDLPFTFWQLSDLVSYLEKMLADPEVPKEVKDYYKETNLLPTAKKAIEIIEKFIEIDGQGFSAGEDGAAQPPTGFGTRGGAQAPTSFSSSGFHVHTFGPLGGPRKAADDLLPSPTAQIPPEFLKAAKERLKDAYPELFKLYKKHIEDRDYFIEPQEGQGLEGLLSTTDGDLLFILDERFNEEHKEAFKLSGEARDLLLFLHLIDISIQLALKEDSLTTDLNQQIISFLYQAEAYLSLEGPQQDLLKQAASIIDTQTGETFLGESFKEMDALKGEELFTADAFSAVSTFLIQHTSFTEKEYEEETVEGYAGKIEELLKAALASDVAKGETIKKAGSRRIVPRSFEEIESYLVSISLERDPSGQYFVVGDRTEDQDGLKIRGSIEAGISDVSLSWRSPTSIWIVGDLGFSRATDGTWTLHTPMSAAALDEHGETYFFEFDPNTFFLELVYDVVTKKLTLIVENEAYRELKEKVDQTARSKPGAHEFARMNGKGKHVSWEIISASEAVARHEEFKDVLKFEEIQPKTPMPTQDDLRAFLRSVLRGRHGVGVEFSKKRSRDRPVMIKGELDFEAPVIREVHLSHELNAIEALRAVIKRLSKTSFPLEELKNKLAEWEAVQELEPVDPAAKGIRADIIRLPKESWIYEEREPGWVRNLAGTNGMVRASFDKSDRDRWKLSLGEIDFSYWQPDKGDPDYSDWSPDEGRFVVSSPQDIFTTITLLTPDPVEKMFFSETRGMLTVVLRDDVYKSLKHSKFSKWVGQIADFGFKWRIISASDWKKEITPSTTPGGKGAFDALPKALWKKRDRKKSLGFKSGWRSTDRVREASFESLGHDGWEIAFQGELNVKYSRSENRLLIKERSYEDKDIQDGLLRNDPLVDFYFVQETETFFIVFSDKVMERLRKVKYFKRYVDGKFIREEVGWRILSESEWKAWKKEKGLGFGAAVTPLSSSAFHANYFGPLGGAKEEADDLLPSPTAQIPPEFLKAAKERLKDAYLELFKLYKKHIEDRDYFIEPQEGQGLEGLLSTKEGDLLFILDERFKEEHAEAFKLSGEARDLLLYLHLIDITIQLALKEDSLTTDLNQQIISFLYQAEAYLSLEGPQRNLLKKAASTIDKQTTETFLTASFKEMVG